MLRMFAAAGFAFVALLVGYPSANAQQSVTQCSIWLKGGPTRSALEHWTIGYLAGMSTIWDMQRLKPENPGGRITKSADAFLYIDAHCRLNPNDDIAVAAFKLFRELAGQK